MYKTPVGFPNIYMTSSAYYNLGNFNPTKYATLLLVFGDLYLLGFVILLHFIDHKLKDIYNIATSNMFLIEGTLVFEYTSSYIGFMAVSGSKIVSRL